MKRAYFGMLFMVISVALIFGAIAIFGEEVVLLSIGKFIVIWILIAFYAG